MFYTTEEAAIVCGFLNLYLLMSLCGDATRHSSLALQRKRCSQRTTYGRRKFSTSLSPVGGSYMKIIEP